MNVVRRTWREYSSANTRPCYRPGNALHSGRSATFLFLDSTGKNLISIRIPPNHLLGTSMTGVAERWMSYRKGRLKLIQECKPATNQYLPGLVELYDLETDPKELVNLAAEHPGLAGELQRELRDLVGGELCTVMQAAMAGVDITVGMDDEGIEALRALGYVGDD